MTQEEKELLLKDLCARLPYGLLINTPRGTFELDAIAGDLISLADIEDRLSDLIQYIDGKYWFPIETGNYKPYLRPMSSMTEKEARTVLNMILGDCEVLSVNIGKDGIDATVDDGVASFERKYIFYDEIVRSVEIFDYLNSIHVDYRGLIPIGLALESSEGMYNFKNEEK